MALGRRIPKSDAEIVQEAEAEAKAWAEWLKPHVAKGIRWVIEGWTGQVALPPDMSLSSSATSHVPLEYRLI